MKKSIAKGLLFIIIMLLLIPVKAVALNCLSQKIVKSTLESGEIEGLLNDLEAIEATVEHGKINELESKVKVAINKKPSNFMFHYLMARVYIMWGEYYDSIKTDKKKTKQSLEFALESAEESIRLKKDFSDSYRLAGDIYGWLIDLKGAIIYGPFYGPKSDRLRMKAEKYDSSNVEVYLAEGRKYLYTPILFGGSRKKALESFGRAVSLCPDYYLAHLWLGRGYIDRGLIEKAKKNFEKALTLEPTGYAAKDELKKINNQ